MGVRTDRTQSACWRKPSWNEGKAHPFSVELQRYGGAAGVAGSEILRPSVNSGKMHALPFLLRCSGVAEMQEVRNSGRV